MQSGPFNVPGRTVVQGDITTSNASLTSSLIQSFSPGVFLLTGNSTVERLANGNFAYTTTYKYEGRVTENGKTYEKVTCTYDKPVFDIEAGKNSGATT